MSNADDSLDIDLHKLLDTIRQQIVKLWAFRWYGVAAAFSVCVVGWVLVGLKEDAYEATARVQIDTSSDIRNILGDQIVQSTIEDKLRLLRETVLGSVQLGEVVHEAGLSATVTTAEEMAGLLEYLRQQITIVDIREENQPRMSRIAPHGTTYAITVQYPQREAAIRLVTVLLNKLREISLGEQLYDSAKANSFLRTQIAQYEKRLNSAEERLAEFNRENYDKLPNMQGGYFSRLQEETTQLSDLQQELSLSEARLKRVERQISGEVPDVGSQIEPTSTRGRILENERRLETLSLQYTDNHPDVVATRQMLADLYERQRTEADIGVAPTNPVYQALLISKNEIEEEVDALKLNVLTHQNRVDKLQGLIGKMPDVEAELARLNRDYEVVKTQYEDLSASLERESLSRDVFTTEQIDFRVIDPPSAAVEPVSPRRGLLMLVVILGSYASAIALPYLLSLFRPVVLRPDELPKMGKISFLGSVQNIESAMERRERIRSYSYVVIAAISLGLFGMSLLLFETQGSGLRALL